MAVIAIGGNSLIKDAQHQSVEDQYEAVRETARHIADLIQAGFQVVVTHGNGPQVGFILLRSEMARDKIHEVPLDVCGADPQGAIGYQIQQALKNEFQSRGLNRLPVTVVTQTVVDAGDPAFQKPSKPIGSFYTAEQAEVRKKEDGWTMVEDAGRGWRRVVASPLPKEILEKDAIAALIKAGFIVVAAGGGGVPVVRKKNGDIRGVAAVIDKDYATSLLANQLGADYLVISTGVDQVCLNFGTPQQKALPQMTVAEAERYLVEGHFKPGSMKPKVEACLQFLKRGGKLALITSPEALPKAVRGDTGTRIVP